MTSQVGSFQGPLFLLGKEGAIAPENTGHVLTVMGGRVGEGWGGCMFGARRPRGIQAPWVQITGRIEVPGSFPSAPGPPPPTLSNSKLC